MAPAAVVSARRTAIGASPPPRRPRAPATSRPREITPSATAAAIKPAGPASPGPNRPHARTAAAASRASPRVLRVIACEGACRSGRAPGRPGAVDGDHRGWIACASPKAAGPGPPDPYSEAPYPDDSYPDAP